MQIWQSITLGFIQGITEFLPISSSGHLILMQYIFGIKDNVLFYSVFLHLGTLLPVVVVLKDEILSLFDFRNKKLFYLTIATIPAGIVGIFFSVFFNLEKIFYNNLYLLGCAFILTAFELLFAELVSKKCALHNHITGKSALIMGIGQAIAVIPGLSRSGTTLTFGCISKVDSESRASFTFLMSIPIILSAVILEGYKSFKNGVITIDLLPLIFGFISSAVVGYISITLMLKIIKKSNYKWFSVYLLILGIISYII